MPLRQKVCETDLRHAGGQGFANVAVTCLLQAASGNQNTAQIPTMQQPPLSPNLTWQELQGHSASPDKSHDQKKTGLLGSAIGAAANVFKAIGNPAKGKLSGEKPTVYTRPCGTIKVASPQSVVFNIATRGFTVGGHQHI